KSRENIPNGELLLSLLRLLGPAVLRWWALLVAAVIEAEKPEDAPGRRRFGIVRPLVEHDALPIRHYCTIIFLRSFLLQMPVEPTYDVSIHCSRQKIIQRLVTSALVENMRQIFHAVLPIPFDQRPYARRHAADGVPCAASDQHR